MAKEEEIMIYIQGLHPKILGELIIFSRIGNEWRNIERVVEAPKKYMACKYANFKKPIIPIKEDP